MASAETLRNISGNLLAFARKIWWYSARTGIGRIAVALRTLVGHGRDYDQSAIVEIGGPRDGHVGPGITVGEHAERTARIGKRNGVAARCRLRQATAEKRR